MTLRCSSLIAAVVFACALVGSDALVNFCAVDGAPLSFAAVPTLTCPNVKYINIDTGHVTYKHVKIGWCRAPCSGYSFMDVAEADSKHPCLFHTGYRPFGHRPVYRADTKDVQFKWYTCQQTNCTEDQGSVADFTVTCDKSLPAHTATCPHEIRKLAPHNLYFTVNSSAVCNS